MRQLADLKRLTPPNTKSIDFAALLKRCMGRVDLMSRILATFRTAVKQEIDELAEALTIQDRSWILAVSHRLKGTCLTASADNLAQIAERLHADVEHGEALDVTHMRELLNVALTELLNQISDWENEAPS